jgi:hypothetical protein
MLFLKAEISQSDFNKMALDIEVNVRHTGADYKALLAKDANSHTILLGYARYLEKCLNNPIEAEKTYRKSEELRIIDDQSGGFGEGGGSESKAMFTIQEDGLIEG